MSEGVFNSCRWAWLLKDANVTRSPWNFRQLSEVLTICQFMANALATGMPVSRWIRAVMVPPDVNTAMRSRP